MTVSVTSADTGAVSVDKSSLMFTTTNWNTAQSVTVTGVPDDDAVDESVRVDLAASGGDYGGVTGVVTVSVDDDETVGLVVSPGSLNVDEGDTTGDSFTVALSSQPTAQVTVAVSSADPGAVAVSQSSLTFTVANWATAQSVTATGVQDADAADENVTVSLSASGGDYGSVTGAVTVDVDDDETAALNVSVSTLALVEGGAAASFTVALATPPTQTVTVAVSSSDVGAVTVDKSSLTFTAADWNTAQTVTVAPVDDADAGDERVTVDLAANGGEYTLVTGSVAVTVDDDETAALSVSVSSLDLDEGGTDGSFTVALATPPTQTVTVAVSSADVGAVTVTQQTLTFTAADWNTAQTVTVSPVDDADAKDESVSGGLSASGGEYQGVTAAVTVNVDDDETAALVLSTTSLTVDEGDATGATFTVCWRRRRLKR